MDLEMMEGIKGLMTLLGFVGVIAGFGAFKGETAHRIKDLENKVDKHETSIEELKDDHQSLKVQVTSMAAEIKVKLDYIQEQLAGISRRIGGE